MTQKNQNIQKAQKLTNAELGNVNGGKWFGKRLILF